MVRLGRRGGLVESSSKVKETVPCCRRVRERETCVCGPMSDESRAFQKSASRAGGGPTVGRALLERAVAWAGRCGAAAAGVVGSALWRRRL